MAKPKHERNRIPHTLTERQRQILEFIEAFICTHSFPPTVREIGRQFHIASPNGVVSFLNALQNKGYIQRAKRLSRGLKVIKSLQPKSE